MKKILLVLTIIINILLISLIPLNIYVLSINIPEYISIIMEIIIITLNILITILNKKINILLLMISVIAILFGLFGTYCNPYWNSISYKNNSFYTKNYDTVITKKEALEDLDYAMKYLKKLHPKLLKNMPNEIQEQYDIVKNNLKTEDTITVNYLSKEIESILSKLNDAHTIVIPKYNNYHTLKEMETHNKNKEVLTKINDIEIKELYEQNKIYYSYEMETAGLKQFQNDLITLEGLDKLGINTNEIKYTFGQNNKEKEYTYQKDDYLTTEEYNNYNNIGPKPKKSFITYEIDKENNVAILYLDICKNNDEYKRVLKDFFKNVKENNIKNIAVDLRNNGGGDSSVATEFLKYIDIDTYNELKTEWRLGTFNIKIKQNTIKNKKNKNAFDGDIYVLTSIDTFSSAMIFAQYIKDNNIGTIIGEASSNNPNSTGDIVQFKLPNSNVYMQISTKKFYRINQNTEEQFIEPDINCESKEAIFKLYDTIKSISEN